MCAENVRLSYDPPRNEFFSQRRSRQANRLSPLLSVFCEGEFGRDAEI